AARARQGAPGAGPHRQPGGHRGPAGGAARPRPPYRDRDAGGGGEDRERRGDLRPAACPSLRGPLHEGADRRRDPGHLQARADPPESPQLLRAVAGEPARSGLRAGAGRGAQGSPASPPSQVMRKLSVKDLDLRGKRVFCRVDFNVPLEEGRVTDDRRIAASLPTIRFLSEKGARVVLASHLGRPKGKPKPEFSLRPCAERLESLLKKKVAFASDCVGEPAETAAR